MNSRFFSTLLSVLTLVAIAACSTTAPRPAGIPDQAPPDHTDTIDSELRVRAEDNQQDPSRRSIAEVADLSRKTGIQPVDLALEITRSLEHVPSGQLTSMIVSRVYEPEFTEWLELVSLVRRSLMDDGSVTTNARYWQAYHYGHAIDQTNFPALVSRYSSFFTAPSQVAILLPFEGGLAAAGRAIRDGIISAYMKQPNETVIRFYPSGDSVESALAAYYLAREEGATQIIGPLRMESTQALASLENHDLPILLLNDPATGLEPGPGPANNVNSLSLSQTWEAAAIAEQLLSHGHASGLVIVPQNAWGQRIESTFSSTLIRGEGNIPASARFDPATSDHSAVLTATLKIDESKQRKQDLQSRVGISLEFEPIRRDDFDFIFLAANPTQGRELKPLIKFHDAGDVPVYAMSRVYDGRAGVASNRDLDGVIFPATPWQLETADRPLPALASLRDGSFGNLYALGQDAWRLLPWLPLLRKDPDLEFHGSTGALAMQADGQLSRRPSWAQFSSGRPVAFAWPPRH